MNETVGKYIPASSDQPEIIEREYYGQGMIYKNWEAYETDPSAVCYIPELSDSKYTREGFLDICNGNEELAKELFLSVDWQHPETVFDEWVRECEVATCEKCGWIFKCYNDQCCPKCGAKFYDENMLQEVRNEIQLAAGTSEMEKDCSGKVLMPFYFTFGSDDSFPYRNGYIVVFAEDLLQSFSIFREHYPDIHQDCLNCSFYYTEEQWEKTGMGKLDDYPCYKTIYPTNKAKPSSGKGTREFYIDTPLGKIKVYAKHQKDTPNEYPGVFVDFIDNEGELITLACTEYDSLHGTIQTCVYGDGNDDSPTNVVQHQNLQPDE